ncbi:Xaa-Pro peptidase family protein [soil metagenome]
MHQEQRERTKALLESKGLKRALFANLNSVKWLTGFAPPIQTGPNLFAGGPPLVWYEDGHYTLIVLDGQAGETADLANDPDCTVVTYLGYTIQQPVAGAEHLRTALRQVLSKTPRMKGQIGIEMADLTISLAQILQEMLGDGAENVAIDQWLVPLRMIKTLEELTKLRENFALTDVGHAAARKAIRPGQREIDLWTEIHSAIQQKAGRRIPLGNDCVVGYRQANIGGWPGDLEIREHDSVIVDLSTLAHGYWSDSCATYYAGEPTAEQIALHHTIEQALDYVINLVRPGVVAKTLDQKARQFIIDAGYPAYPHHTGHGVGVTGHEEPRIVPYNEVVLEAGMVIMLEPGAYVAGKFGVRLEDALLITADGVEVLTKHDKRLP